ncbi:MAG: alpha amylase N-terminal ig-like domain-containing protein [Planctomycetota bacterium]
MLKQLTVHRAAIRSTVPGLCAILIALVLGSTTRADEPVIRMAGTFNNWSTSNDDYRLTKVGERYELVRFWPCGMYEFKFVFDGTWSRHLGMGDDGKLGQPGRDIELCVEQSGVYAIQLDVGKRQHKFEKRAPERLKAFFTIQECSLNRFVLDGTRSISRSGHPIKTYQWTISGGPPGEGAELHTSICATLERPLMAIGAPGRYVIELSVNDGEVKDTVEITQELGAGYYLKYPKFEGWCRPSPSIQLHRASGHVWVAFLEARSNPRPPLAVRSTSSQFGDPNEAAVSSFPDQRNEVVVAFDDVSKQTRVLTDGFCRFRFRPDQAMNGLRGRLVERVEIVGDFNGWRAGTNPMHETEGQGFERLYLLPDGLYHYRFLVNGCIFLEDPNADPKYREPDGKGGFNSGFRIGIDPAMLGSAKADDVNEKAVKHDPADASYFASIGNELLTLRIRTLAGDAMAVAAQFFNTEGATEGMPIPLSNAGTRDGFDYWSAVCTPRRGPPRYTFLIEDGNEHCILDADGPHSFAANEKIALFPRPFAPDTGMSFETPDWAKRAVWYQIFPERFRNGDASNDPPTTVPWTHEWYKAFKGPKAKAAKQYVETGDFWDFIFDRRYGGDIQGVQEKLPYLRKLGITAIYFNPMFLAESMHKYDASDYRHIDDYFGVKNSLRKIKGESTDPKTWQWSQTDRIFLDFIKEAHRQGFKVVLDGVFNHVGRDFWAFKDVLKKGEKSEYVGWFDITSFKPFHYKAWDKDDGSLPRLKHDDALGLAKPVREHLFAVTRRWMDPDGDGDPSDGIDGWRLDVAADINSNFWRDWRKLVKSINPNGYIVAEIWEESKSWLDGQTFDAVMNYPFARAAQRFFVNQKKASKPSEFQKELLGNLAWYAPQVNYVLQNLYCSHDTDRVTSMFMNPDLEYDKANRQQDNGPKYVVKRPTAECYQKFRQMVAFQMTFLGAPMIYYGDEVGMYGADDPSDRKPMWWDDLMPFDDPDEHIEPGLFEHHQRLIAIRNTYPALQLGSFEPLMARDDHGVFAYCRSLNDERVVVVFNNSDHAHRLELESPWPDGTQVDRVDDPMAFEVVEAKDEISRSVVRPIGKHESSLKIEKGRLHGCMIEPRTAGIFVKS